METTAPGLGDALVHLLRVMERTGGQLAGKRQDGLERAAFHALLRLVHDGPQRSRELAEAVYTDPSAISRHVAHLVELDLVERRADPDDGRATLLAATAAGVAKAAQLRRRRDGLVDAVVADWAPAERAQFAALLTRFTADLGRSRPALLAARWADSPTPDMTPGPGGPR